MSLYPGKREMSPELMEYSQDSDSEGESSSDHEAVKSEFLDDDELETLEEDMEGGSCQAHIEKDSFDCATDADVPHDVKVMVRMNEVSEAVCTDRQERQMVRQVDVNGEHEDFYEVDDGRDAALLTEDATRFEWVTMESCPSARETFTPEQTGSVTPRRTMYDAFRAYWSDDILEHIVTETNRYASEIPSEDFRKRWYPTNTHEILILFSFWIMIGIHKMPTIKSCFSLNPLLETKIFKRMFNIHRYSNLCRALHFCNNSARPRDASRLYLLGPVIDHLNTQFKAHYIPSQNLSLDESLTLWKGLLFFKQYIARKVAKYGIKTFELCEATTGYLWSFHVYTGKNDLKVEDAPSSVLKSTSVVIKLMRPLLEKGYTLYMDSWFNSPILARFLKSHKTDCVGTLRSTRRGVPPLLHTEQLRKGDIHGWHAGDVSVLAWQDKKKVSMISTYHGTEQNQVTIGKGTHTSTVFKPQVILDYNINMGGVDRKDQMLEPYLMERKRHKKWYMKLFKRLLNCSILNSRILVESTTKAKIDHLNCRLSLVDSILSQHLSGVPVSRKREVRSNASLMLKSASFAHWPVRVAQLAEGETRNQRMRCALCSRKKMRNKKTPYKCKQCDVPLCVECFEEYHT